MHSSAVASLQSTNAVTAVPVAFRIPNPQALRHEVLQAILSAGLITDHPIDPVLYPMNFPVVESPPIVGSELMLEVPSADNTLNVPAVVVPEELLTTSPDCIVDC